MCDRQVSVDLKFLVKIPPKGINFYLKLNDENDENLFRSSFRNLYRHSLKCRTSELIRIKLMQFQLRTRNQEIRIGQELNKEKITRNKELETRNQKQGTRNQKLETRNQKQETRNQKEKRRRREDQKEGGKVSLKEII